MAPAHDSTECPLGAVHQRLDDTHRLWHQARDSYLDPDAFRVAVHNCISSLRTVSFILQSNKALIPNFDEWYRAWQDRMRADEILKWAKDARNKIEKEGDLVTHSTIRAEIVASYLNELPIMDVKASIKESVEEIFARVPRFVLKEQILQHGYLRVERRWVDEELPDQEILDALSHVYGQLALMLDDAHRQLGLTLPTVVTVDHGGRTTKFPADAIERRGRLPCMIADTEHRTTFIALKTGRPLVMERKEHEIDLSDAAVQRIRKRYDFDGLVRSSQAPTTLKDSGEFFFSMARTAFQRDGYHIPLVIYLRGLNLVTFDVISAEDRAAKYMMMRHVAADVERYSADGLLLINEVWVGQYTPDMPFSYPADMPDREEGLQLLGANASGEMFTFFAKIRRRRFRKPVLEQTVFTEASGGKLEASVIAPVQEVWAKRV